MKLFLAILFIFVSSCNSEKKERNSFTNSETFNSFGFDSVQKHVNQLILPHHRLWVFNRVSFKRDQSFSQKTDVFRARRTVIDDSAYIILKDVPIDQKANYKLSILVKKGEVGNCFGLRIMGEYPNRIDAVFDLQAGKVKGIQNSGDFSMGKASIMLFNKDWYKCELVGEFKSDVLQLIFGPTSGNNKTIAWEGPEKEFYDNYIIPSSLILEEVLN